MGKSLLKARQYAKLLNDIATSGAHIESLRRQLSSRSRAQGESSLVSAPVAELERAVAAKLQTRAQLQVRLLVASHSDSLLCMASLDISVSFYFFSVSYQKLTTRKQSGILAGRCGGNPVSAAESCGRIRATACGPAVQRSRRAQTGG